MKYAIILTLFFHTCSIQNETLPEKYDIVLCVGQSNMVGYRAYVDTQDNGSQAYLWNDTGWEVADGCLNRYSNVSPPPSGQWLSLANTFGKEAKQRNPKLGIVMNAMAGSFIETWDTLFMRKSIDRLNAALNAQPNSKVTAILWHQGESNMYDAHNWMIHFKSIRRQVDSLVGYDVTIIVGGLAASVPGGWTGIMNDTLASVQTQGMIVISWTLSDCQRWMAHTSRQRVQGY